jgi:hypothetical protein
MASLRLCSASIAFYYALETVSTLSAASYRFSSTSLLSSFLSLMAFFSASVAACCNFFSTFFSFSAVFNLIYSALSLAAATFFSASASASFTFYAAAS